VDFQLTDDQLALADGISSLVEGRMPLDRLRRVEGENEVIDPADWQALGEAGVFSLTLSEAEGGVGLGLADATVVFEALGRLLVPGPLVPTLLAAGIIPGAAEGECIVGTVTVGGDTEPVLIEHPLSLNALLLFPRVTTNGTATGPLLQIDPRSLDVQQLARPLDPLTPMAQIVGALPAGQELADHATATRLWHAGTVLTAALQVGHATAAMELAVAYAKGRYQFGRPIGGFQAVKHMCADMLVRAEVARCAVHAAATMADQPDVAEIEALAAGRNADEMIWRAATGAKLLADEAALANGKTSIQVHGGMGFTWEVPVHLSMKRARVLATTFGSADHLAEVVAGLL
jgi:alkylation response protein AidB-like acyl-CoA dehydrogenase